MILDFCVACGEREPSKLENHHLVPRSAGGSDDPTNLITLCHVCHGKAHGMERRHIKHLTKIGIARAKANGKSPGNPRMTKRDPEALQRISEARDAAYLDGLLQTYKDWLPIVEQMRPKVTWMTAAKALNDRAGSEVWTTSTLNRAVWRLVSEGLAPAHLLERAPRVLPEMQSDAIAAVTKMLEDDPDISLRAMAAKLYAMKIPNRRGGLRWGPSSVNFVLKKIKRGLYT